MRLLAALTATTLLLASCSGSTEQAGDGPSSVRIGFGLEPTGLDPTTTSGAALEQLALDNVYEGLVTRDETGEIVPRLATEWAVSDDGLTYTFTLRDGVTFHDGSEFDADDVVASLEAAAADDSANPDAKLMTGVTGVNALDESTVEVTLAERNINMLDTLASNAGVIVPSDNTVDLASASNGTGPFTIGEWNTGSSITLTAFDNYWGEAPAIDEAVFQYYADELAAANALASGEVDILTYTTPQTVARFESNDEFTVTRSSETAWMTLAFNHTNEFLKDKEIRRGIRMAIDKPGLITALGGLGQQVGSMTSPADAWWDESLLEVDEPDANAAKEILADKNISLNLRVADNYDTAMVEYVAAQLEAAGVSVDIQQMDFATWLDDVYTKKNYDMTIVQHVDPWTLTYYGNPGYYWNYDNAGAQELAQAAIGASSIEERDEKLGELARYVAEDAASDWLYSPDTVLIAPTTITGYPTTRIGSQFHIRDIQIDKP